MIVLEDRAELLSARSEPEKRERERAPFATRVFVNPVLTPIGDDHVMPPSTPSTPAPPR